MTRNSNELSLGKVQLDYYRQSWNLQEDGDAFSTNYSRNIEGTKKGRELTRPSFCKLPMYNVGDFYILNG